MAMSAANEKLIVGKISGVYGVKGWVKVYSDTDPREDTAMQLTGALIAITPDQLQALSENEFYWRDLIGLRVINREGIELGTVQRLMETGANDVLVVSDEQTAEQGGREHLVPWTPGQAVLEVDLEQGRIQVDWDEDF